MSIEIEGLEFQIEAKSDSALKGIDALASSFTRLKKALGGKGLDGLSTKLEAISTAVSDAGIGRLEGLSRALGTLGAVKISSTVPKRMTEISAALDELTQEKIERVGALSTALQGMGRLDLPDLSKLSRVPSSRADTSTGRKGAAQDTTAGDAAGAMSKIAEEISQATSASGKLKSVMDGVGTAASKVGSIVDGNFAKAFPGVETLTTQLKPLGAAFGGLTGKLQAFAAVHPAVAIGLKTVGVAVKATLTEMKKLGASAVSVAQKGFEYLKAAAQKLKGELGSLARGAMGKFGSGLKSIGRSITGHFTRPFTKAIKTFSTWKSSIGRVAFYRMVRTAIKAVTDGLRTGIDNLYQYSHLVGTQFAPAMNSLATSAQYLKNSFGAMAAPLIEALAPAIDFVIDKFVGLLNIIGKVFAALTGKSVYTQAKRQATEYADAAGDAAKATQSFLMGIDELNIIDPTSGSGGGAGTDFGSMFEEVEVPSDIVDWANKIRDAIDQGDWQGAGEILGDKLNEIVDKWDAESWGRRLGEKINNALNFLYGLLTTFDFEKLGRKVAEAINGIFDTVDFDLLGRTFAAGWNALFDFIYGFATTLHWADIGHSIAEAVNGFVDEIHWDRMGQAISEGLKGIFLMINTAIREIEWGKLAEGVATALNNIDWYGVIHGALSVLTNALAAGKEFVDSFIATFRWSDTARQIYTAINDAFAAVDWNGLGQTLGNAFKTIFDFFRETIAGIDWYAIGKDIADFLNGIDWVETLSSLADFIAEGINSAIKAVKGLIENLNISEIAKGIGESINKFIGEIDWEEAGRTLSDGINAAVDFAITFIETIDWGSIWQNVATFINTAIRETDWDDVGKAFGEMLRTKIQGVTAFLREIDWAGIVRAIVNFLSGMDWIGFAGDLTLRLFELIGAAVEGVIALIIDLPKILMIGAEIVAGILTGIVKAIFGLPGWLKEHLIDPIVDGVKDLLGIHSPSTVFMEIGGNIVAGLLEGLTKPWSDIIGFFDEKIGALKESVSQAWDDIKTTAGEKWASIKETLGTAWEGIKTTASTTFSEVKEKISTAWSETKSKTSETWESIKSTLSSTWEGIKTGASEKFSAVKEKITTVWSEVKSKSSETWESIKSTLTSTWSTIKETASTKFTEVKEKISQVWTDVKSTASTKWAEIKTALTTAWTSLKESAGEKFDAIRQKVGEAWDKIKTEASSKWEGITSTIKEKWSGLVSSAQSWGSDLCRNISSGIQSGISWVTNAVSGVAGKINSYLHFTEPDVGPLSNFHTYMPDMLKLMANGINDNAYLAENAVYDLADSVSRAFNSVSPDDLELPTERALSVRYAVDTSRDLQGESGGRDFGKVEVNNAEVVNALYSVAAQIVNAIDEKDMSVNIDGKQMMRSVEKAKRQRGADILSGGVMP